MVAYGLENTSKVEVISAVLKEREIQHAIVKSKECLSQRHLLSKIFAACASALEEQTRIDQYDKVDSINVLLGNLRKIFDRHNDAKFVVVIEGIDKLKQAGPTLLPALARLGNQVYRPMR